MAWFLFCLFFLPIRTFEIIKQQNRENKKMYISSRTFLGLNGRFYKLKMQSMSRQRKERKGDDGLLSHVCFLK